MDEETHHCGHEDEEDLKNPHKCPYAWDIGGDDSDDYCTCCSGCEHECAMDI